MLAGLSSHVLHARIAEPAEPVTRVTRAATPAVNQPDLTAVHPGDSVFTEAQAARGARVYAEACEGCHGPDLAGGKQVPGVAGTAFASRWTGRSLADLRDRLVSSMPPEAPESVSLEQKIDVLAYLLQANGWPAGSRELPASRAALARMSFESMLQD